MYAVSQHVQKLYDNAPVVTYTGGASTALFWGLHTNDIALILSTLATIAGVMLQFYVALHRIRVLERAQVAAAITSAGNTAKIDTNAARLDAVQAGQSAQNAKP